MKVLIFPSASEAETHVASTVLRAVERNPEIVLGLATGGTMEAVYAKLVAAARSRPVSFARVRSFNLDEYWGVPADHPCSYATYMRERLFAPLGMDPSRTLLPDGMAERPDEEAKRYEAAIARAGRIDIQLLGIGRNGHIGFNEPTSSLGSRTRIKTLTEGTRMANRRYFDRDEDVPRFALTMGIATILDARRCILLATGAKKARAVAQMVEGPITAICPATALQLHADAEIVLDPEAAGELRLTDYYRLVHPDGAAVELGRGPVE